MEKYLSNLELWIWTYGLRDRNYRGWHLTGKPGACDALSTFLTELRGGGGGKRTIPLRMLQEADERKITGGKSFTCFSIAVFEAVLDQDAAIIISANNEEKKIRISLNSAGVDSLLNILHQVKSSRGDQSVSVQSDELRKMLWYWPCFGHLWVVD